MTYELKIIPNTRIALSCWSGTIDLKKRKENVRTMAQFCRDNGLSQLIVDTRQQVDDATTMQMYDFGASIPEIMRGIQVAVVCRPSARATRFGETVAANRGTNSHSFETIEEAKTWLAGNEGTLNS